VRGCVSRLRLAQRRLDARTVMVTRDTLMCESRWQWHPQLCDERRSGAKVLMVAGSVSVII